MLAKKFASEKETPYTRWVRAEGLEIASSFHVQNLHTIAAEALGAPRRQRRVPQPRRFAHLERLLRDGDPRRAVQLAAAATALRGDDLRPRRPRLHHGVERRRASRAVRVEGRIALRDPAELPAPALQRLGQGTGPLCRCDQRARRSSTCTATSTSSSARVTTSATASTASPTTSRTRASRRACCSTRTSSPTRSTCR